MQATTDNLQPVFRSLADPTRRAILQMLGDHALNVGDIADHFDMTRPAVAKHLKFLQDADLITIRREGRERINMLNPGALKGAMDWLNYFDRFWDDRLAYLKQIVEKEE